MRGGTILRHKRSEIVKIDWMSTIKLPRCSCFLTLVNFQNYSVTLPIGWVTP
jgi:hypothetical protein